MLALTQPHIQDREALQEFLDALTDLVPGIERNIAKLKHKPEDKGLISDLFRGLHTIKGDAALCKVELGVLIAHPLETLLPHAPLAHFDQFTKLNQWLIMNA